MEKATLENITLENTRLRVAVKMVTDNAMAHSHKKPNIMTLLEEVAEAVLASRGKHEHGLDVELVQIGGICINMLWQLGSEDSIPRPAPSEGAAVDDSE